MTEDDLMKLISPVSAMIQGERPIVSWFSIRLPQKIEIRILQGSSGGQKASEISLSPSGARSRQSECIRLPRRLGSVKGPADLRRELTHTAHAGEQAQ